MSRTQNGFQLFSFAWFPTFDESISYLSNDLADNENWDFISGSTQNNSILKNYLEHTFRKLKSDSLIEYTHDNEYCSFNTGLVTKNYENIYAFFERNKNEAFSNKMPFVFKAFLKESETELLRNFSSNLPKRANYFQNPELLIYNPTYMLIPDIDHIIEDNLSRFPQVMQASGGDQIRRILTGAIDESKKKVETNYKTAIPQYYKGKIQLLLPLCLTPMSPNPDLALAISKLPNSDSYTARTCLTLKMAYNNARLIVKPQSEWLKP